MPRDKALTLDELIFEALVAGVEYFAVFEHTFGELIEIVNAYNERTRRQNKTLSVIAMNHARLLTTYVAGKGGDLEVQDVFPFWTADEKKELMLQKYMNIMREQVAKGGGVIS